MDSVDGPVAGSGIGETAAPLPLEDQLVHQLSERKISLFKAIVFAFVDLQFGPTLALFAGYLLVVGGGGSWFSMLIAFLLIMSVTEVVRVFSSRYVVTGGLMTYLVKVNARRAGYFVGGANLLGYLALVAAVTTGVTYFSLAFLRDIGWGSSSRTIQVAAFVIIGVLLTLTALRGLAIASTVAIVLGALSIPFVLWITIQSLVTSSDISWSVLQPQFDHPALLLAPVPLVLSQYVGFDGWAFLAAETDQPQRNVPRILHTVVVGSFAVSLILVLIQLPMLSGFERKINKGFSPLSIMADGAGLGGLATVVDGVLGLALFAAGITTLTYGGRLFAAAATVGVLPRSVAKVSSRSDSPYVAIMVLGAAAVVLPTVLALVVGKSPIRAGIYFSEATAYLWAPTYVVSAAVAGIVIWRSTNRPLVSIAAIAACAVGYTGFIVYSLRDGWRTVNTTLPWICLALMGITFVALLVIDKLRANDIDLNALADVD